MKTTAEDKIKLYVLTHIDMSEQSMQLQEVGTYKGLLRELMRKLRSYARKTKFGFSEKECFNSLAGGLPSFSLWILKRIGKKNCLKSGGYLVEMMIMYQICSIIHCTK